MSITPGAIRFNTDSMKLEYYRGGPVGFGTTTTTGEWVNISTDSPDIQTGGARGVIVCGRNHTDIDYVNISSTGNAIVFGTTTDDYEGFALSSRTRGVFGGTLGYGVNMKFITISSTGGDTTFGDMSVARRSMGSCSNSTRGVLMGGLASTSPNYSGSNVLDYITIASTGDAVDFGDLYTGAGNQTGGGWASSTRGIHLCGSTGTTPNISNTNIIQYITISTLGNSADFGDATSTTENRGACSNSVRGIHGNSGSPVATLDYGTIATLGNLLEFGDLTRDNSYIGATASSTRGIFAGGGPDTNKIDYVQIMSTGNAIDFGDLTNARRLAMGISNGHGGLG